MASPARHFVTVVGPGGPRCVHYARMGDGLPVLLLHASATSSGEMRLPQGVFARDFTAIAFDTPGYGLSDPLALGAPRRSRTMPTRSPTRSRHWGSA